MLFEQLQNFLHVRISRSKRHAWAVEFAVLQVDVGDFIEIFGDELKRIVACASVVADIYVVAEVFR